MMPVPRGFISIDSIVGEMMQALAASGGYAPPQLLKRLVTVFIRSPTTNTFMDSCTLMKVHPWLCAFVAEYMAAWFVGTCHSTRSCDIPIPRVVEV